MPTVSNGVNRETCIYLYFGRKGENTCASKYMSRVVRKPDFCICENKDADQLRGNREADQRLCFRYTDSTIIRKFKPLASFCGSTDKFVSDLVGNPEGRFSHNEAHISSTRPDIGRNLGFLFD